jgi:phage terminase Nu1 subunit (DNA packaging protein)
MASTVPSQKLLTSWKKIAAFFGKGVRTVQRWEAIGLPIHRPGDDKRIVVADPRELNAWALRKRTPVRSPERQRCHELIEESKIIAEQTRLLVARSHTLIRTLKQFS